MSLCLCSLTQGSGGEDSQEADTDKRLCPHCLGRGALWHVSVHFPKLRVRSPKRDASASESSNIHRFMGEEGGGEDEG